jgi:hypothetical protein
MSDAVVPRPILGFDVPMLWRSPVDRRWDRVRWAVLAGWILLVVALPFVGERTANWGDVHDLVASRKVHSVVIDNELPPSDNASGKVIIHWRHGVLRYVTTVRQTNHVVFGEDYSEYNNDDVTEYLNVAPSDRLRELQPGLKVTRGPGSSAYENKLLGFVTQWPYGNLKIFFWLVGLTVLVAGPQPWRATRWAWFWWCTNPLGIAAFLLLSGPLVRWTKPERVNRRLTGGWSFLLAVVPTLSFTLYGTSLHF